MSRPKIQVENYQAVYDYYRTHRQGKLAAKVLHGALGTAFRAKIGFEKDAAQKISEIFESGRTVVLASNHVKAVDPCVIAALPSRSDVMKPVNGTTFIPAKPSIFKVGAVRRLVDGLGAVPVWRDGDIDPSTQKTAYASASRVMLTTCVAKMNAGEHMAIFPEGTRNKIDPARVQELKGGVGLMICKVSKVEQPAIIPIGIHYDESGLGMLSPTVCIGIPSDAPFARPREVMDWLPDRMQTVVDQAHDL